MERAKDQVQYTTIERTFRNELAFIKLCGGFMFQSATYLNIVYRLAMIIFSRFLNVRHYSKYPREFETFSKAAWQNVRLFWFSYHIISHTTVFVNLLTGIKYHNLILIILKKRFDIRYLCGGAGSEESWRSSSMSSLAGSPTSSAGGRSVSGREEASPSERGVRQSSRVRTARKFFIANLLLTTIGSYLRDQTYSRFQVQRVETQLFATSNSSSIVILSNATNYTAPVMLRPPKLNESLTDRHPQTNHHHYQHHHRQHKHHHHQQQHLANSTNWFRGPSRVWFQAWSFMPPGLYRAILVLGHIMFAFMQAALNINQTYGQLFVVLMVTATITDMLSYSCAHDGLISRKEMDQANKEGPGDGISSGSNTTKMANNTSDNKYRAFVVSNSATSQRPDGPDATTTKEPARGRARQRRRPLLTTELLVQARDVLIVLRCAMSLDYLMLLIFDLASLMSNFCMFNAAITTERFDTILLIFIDYISIAFSMSLTRLGYHWLHDRVRKLKRMVDERNLLLLDDDERNHDSVHINNNNNNSRQQSKSTFTSGKPPFKTSSPMGDDGPSDYYNALGMSQSERITTYRLADHISDLWPTDWFTPDLKGYLKHNIFVITFVATLQQLVEAGSKFEYQPSEDK